MVKWVICVYVALAIWVPLVIAFNVHPIPSFIGGIGLGWLAGFVAVVWDR